MNKEKQIKEMAKATMKHCEIDNQCGSCHWSTCNECLAEVLYNAGYRKTSEVAREIFEEIESKKLFVKDRIGNMRAVVLFEDVAELKKKYEEIEKDDAIYKHYTNTGATYITSEPKESEDTE